jgi:hypothetical protein
MATATTLRPALVPKGPSISESLDTRTNIRKLGGFYPEQQTFLGASIRSFNITTGTGSSPTTLTVELVEDPSGTNPTIDDTSKGRGVYDPYHHNKVGGDSFSPPSVGMPVFFVYSNPRVTIREAYDPLYKVKSYESVLKFGGILKSYHQTNSISGRTFSVSVSDPREILGNIFLILNHSDDKIGYNENNVFNVFGFLEYNPTKSTRDMFKSYSANLLRRDSLGAKFGGDDMYWNGAAPPNSTNTPNDFRYFDNGGYLNKFPVTGTGMSRRSKSGMPYYRIMQGLAAMNSDLPNTEYSGFSGRIYYRGLLYGVNFENLPPIHPMHFFDYDNVDLLSFLLEMGEVSGHELVVTLTPDFTSTNTSDTDMVGGIINVSFLDRSNESTVGEIRSFINNPNNFPYEYKRLTNGGTLKEKIIEKEDLGYEMTNPTTSRVIFGANRVDLHAFTSNHDEGRWNVVTGQGASNENTYDQIIPYYGTLKNNTIVPTKGRGQWKQILLDSSGLGAFGVGNYYVATETELRYALQGFKSWKNFLEFFNAKFLDILKLDPKYKHQDILMHGQQGLVFNDDINGTHVRGLKVPRCLFMNDTGFSVIGGETFAQNPCCPPYGYPLYYNRAIAIGLTVNKILDERSSVIGDLRLLTAYGGDTIKLQKVINGLLQKYQNLYNKRGYLSQVEIDAIKILKSQKPGIDNAFIDNAINTLSAQINVPAKNKATRSENVQTVFAFIKNIADECYGRKWLVKIPQKPNYKFDSNVTSRLVKLRNNNNIIERGNFGFKPEKMYNSTTVGGLTITSPIGNLDQACPNGNSFVYTANDPYTNSAQSQFKPALVTNYNPIDDSLVYNYTPDSNGGFMTSDLYAMGVRSAMIPRDLTSFGSDFRIKPYIKYDHAQKLNLTSDNSKIYTEYLGDVTTEQYDRINSVPNKRKTLGDAFSSTTNSGTMISYLPVQMDTEIYHPLITVSRGVGYCGNYKVKTHYKPAPVGLDASGNLLQNSGDVESQIELIPTFARKGTHSISDYPRNKFGLINAVPNIAHSYVLITSPSLVSQKYDNLGDMPKRNSYAVATYRGYFPDEAALNTVDRIKVNRVLDFHGGGGLTFYSPDRLFSSPVAIKPDLVVLPLENQQVCYGPWTNGAIRYKNEQNQYEWKTMKNLGGKIDIQTDASLAPWNFASYELMNLAGNAKVQLANTLYLASEKGSVTYPGLPMGKQEIGTLINKGGPILDGISVDVSSDGVHTSYRFQTYSRSFAHVQKQMEKRMDIVKNSVLKQGQIQFELMHKGLLKNKFKGSAPPATSSKPYKSPVPPYYTNTAWMDRISASLQTAAAGKGPRKAPQATRFESFNGSTESAQEVNNQTDEITLLAADDYNSAHENAAEQVSPVARQHHNTMPHLADVSQEEVEDLYTDPNDNYTLRDNIVTYWS